jgi:ABC-2 type transport system permease protein
VSATQLERAAAVARRDLTILASYNVQFVMRLGRLLFAVAGLFFFSQLVRSPAELQPYGGHYFEFVIVGFVLGAFATVGLGAFTRSIADEQQAGTLEMLLAAPTRLATLLAGSLLVPLAMTLLQVVTLMTISVLGFGADFTLSGVLVAIPVLFLTAATFCAFGILSASFIVLTKRGDPFTPFIVQAGTLISGALFPTAVLPDAVAALAKFVPAFYGLDALRQVLLLGAGLGDVADRLAVLTAFAAVLLPLSITAFSRALRIARVTGTLGTY